MKSKLAINAFIISLIPVAIYLFLLVKYGFQESLSTLAAIIFYKFPFVIVFFIINLILGISALVTIKNNPKLQGKKLAWISIIIPIVIFIILFLLIIEI